MPRFYEHKNAVLEGVGNVSFGGYNPSDALAGLSAYIEQMGFNGAKDKDMVQALWRKAVSIPTGYTDRLTWQFFADYILEHGSKIVTAFDYLRKGIARNNLATLLGTIPSNPSAEISEREMERRWTPSEEVYKPILQAVNDVITK